MIDHSIVRVRASRTIITHLRWFLYISLYLCMLLTRERSTKYFNFNYIDDAVRVFNNDDKANRGESIIELIRHNCNVQLNVDLLESTFSTYSTWIYKYVISYIIIIRLRFSYERKKAIFFLPFLFLIFRNHYFL